MFISSKLVTAALGAFGLALLVFLGDAYDNEMGIICILIGCREYPARRGRPVSVGTFTREPRRLALGSTTSASRRSCGRGDEAAFEALYDRHHASLLAFCRHMVGNREDGEDALQQTFLRAHRALREGRPPDSVRPWLFAIARNRCRTLLAARRDAAIPSDELEPSYDGLAEDVGRRADLRELVADLAGAARGPARRAGAVRAGRSEPSGDRRR